MTGCKAVCQILGLARLSCDVSHPHPGIAHTDSHGRAVWCSDGEARRVDGAERLAAAEEEVEVWEPGHHYHQNIPVTEADWDEWARRRK